MDLLTMVHILIMGIIEEDYIIGEDHIIAEDLLIIVADLIEADLTVVDQIEADMDDKDANPKRGKTRRKFLSVIHRINKPNFRGSVSIFVFPKCREKISRRWPVFTTNLIQFVSNDLLICYINAAAPLLLKFCNLLF